MRKDVTCLSQSLESLAEAIASEEIGLAETEDLGVYELLRVGPDGTTHDWECSRCNKKWRITFEKE